MSGAPVVGPSRTSGTLRAAACLNCQGLRQLENLVRRADLLCMEVSTGVACGSVMLFPGSC